MNHSVLAIMQMLDRNQIDHCVPFESITGKFTIDDLKTLADQGLIRPSEKETFDPQADFEEQLKPGIRLTQSGNDFLFRSRFLI